MIVQWVGGRPSGEIVRAWDRRNDAGLMHFSACFSPPTVEERPEYESVRSEAVRFAIAPDHARRGRPDCSQYVPASLGNFVRQALHGIVRDLPPALAGGALMHQQTRSRSAGLADCRRQMTPTRSAFRDVTGEHHQQLASHAASSRMRSRPISAARSAPERSRTSSNSRRGFAKGGDDPFPIPTGASSTCSAAVRVPARELELAMQGSKWSSTASTVDSSKSLP